MTPNGITAHVDSSCAGNKLADIVGKHWFHTYARGWEYEAYIKNATTMDYRVHSGIVAGRWVRDQKVEIVPLRDQLYKISWTEVTGTSVSLTTDLEKRHIHGTIFFPQWVHRNPEKTCVFQNDHLDELAKCRETGPIYPIVHVDEMAKIVFLENCGADKEDVISVPPSQLPPGYISRRN